MSRPSAARDAGALLAAVLQRVQAEIGQLRRLRMMKNPEYPALLVQFLHSNAPPSV